tara:strand:+ start:7412 stop:8287 length:876 start_codon:yes stop_codon:yes gene_type:complete
MAAISGKRGAVDGQGTVKNWNIGIQSNLPAYRASNTLLGTGRVRGIQDWSGSFDQITSGPTLFPGETFTFKGFCGPLDPTGVSPRGTIWEGTAIVSEVAITWDWRNNELVSSTISFESAGPLTVLDDQGEIEDLTIPDLESVCGLKVEYYNTADAWVVWPNVASVNLRLRSENPTFSNSSTISAGKCYVSRTQGPLDFDLDIMEDNETLEDQGISIAANVGDDVAVRVYVDATKFWGLTWCKLDAVSDFTVDIETGRVIDRTLNFKMNGFVDGAVGSVYDPIPALKWGTAP